MKAATAALTAFVLGLLSLIAGGSLVIFPPYFAFGLVGICLILLLWVMPNIAFRMDASARISLYLFIIANDIVPYYYTLVLPGLPWINIRRMAEFALIGLTALMISSSSDKRAQVVRILKASPLVSYVALGFAVTQFLSVLTSISLTDSIREYANSALLWYTPFLCALMVVRPADMITIAKIVVACAIINCGFGLVEFHLGHPYLHLLLPTSIKDQLLAENPRFAPLFTTGELRNGIYRATSTFIISLSWGEFSAMTASLAAYFIVQPQKSLRTRTFGFVGLAACVVSVFLSGSRGAYLGLFTSLASFFFFWAYRKTKDTPAQFSGVMIMAFYWLATPAVVLAALLVGSIRRIVIGGGAVQNSNEGRSIQWALGMPKVWARPFLGYGPSQSGVVVGFYPNGIEAGPTVDSYALTLLTENGIPAFLCFFGTLIAAIFVSLSRYMAAAKPAPHILLAFGCSLVAFLSYRPFLSQRDNHAYMLLMLAMVLILGAIRGPKHVDLSTARRADEVSALSN